MGILAILDNALVRGYLATGGRLVRTSRGIPALVLTTTGRRTGLPRTHLVGYGRWNEAYVIIGSNRGSDQRPDWSANLSAEPSARIEVGTQILDVRARLAMGAERDRLWQLMSQRHPAYLSNTDRVFPVFLLEPLP